MIQKFRIVLFGIYHNTYQSPRRRGSVGLSMTHKRFFKACVSSSHGVNVRIYSYVIVMFCMDTKIYFTSNPLASTIIRLFGGGISLAVFRIQCTSGIKLQLLLSRLWCYNWTGPFVLTQDVRLNPWKKWDTTFLPSWKASTQTKKITMC